MNKQSITKLRKTHVILIAALIVGFGVSKLFQHSWGDAVIELKEQQLHVLVAKNRYQLQKGLGDRESLDDFDGMLFMFSGKLNRPGIVMRDMEFPIDIVWFYGNEVIDIAKNIQPEKDKKENELTPYYPRTFANIVIEFPAGWADNNNLKIGDRLILKDE